MNAISRASFLTARLLALTTELILTARAELEVTAADDAADPSGMSQDEPVHDPAKNDRDGAYPGGLDWYNAHERTTWTPSKS